MRHNGSAMTLRPNVVLSWLGTLLGSALLGGCSSATDGACVVGTDGCICFPNMTCERGLECAPASNTCTAPISGTGGAPTGQSGSGSTAVGDDAAPEVAGTTGSASGGAAGASTASGGAGTGEPAGAASGGNSPTGGTTATAGDAASGATSVLAGSSSVGGGDEEGGSTTTADTGGVAAGGASAGTEGLAGTHNGGTTEDSGGIGPGGAGAGGAGGTPATGGTDATGGIDGSGVPLNVELIENGDFSEGSTAWSVSGGSGTFTANGALCVSGQGGNNPLMGWPSEAADGIEMAAGTTYELSFRFRGQSTGFDVKVGGVYDPWPEAFRDTELPETAENWQNADLTVTIPDDWGADSGGAIASGIAFVVWFSAGQMEFCVDDVSLMRVE